MSANIIIFDSQYTDDQIKKITNAGKCLEEAIQILQKSSSHRGWQCKEVKDINDSLDNINSSLKKINRGVTAASQALNRGRERFNILETRSQRESQKLSDNLREQYGFNASVRGKDEKTNLPVTEVPQKEDSFIVKAIKGTAKNVILGLGTVIGTALGGIVNGIKSTVQGFMTDVNDAIITPMVDIFKASYSIRGAIAEQRFGDVAQAIKTIFASSASLIATAAGLDGVMKSANTATNAAINLDKAAVSKAGKLEKVGDIADVYDTSNTVFDIGYSAGETIKNPANMNDTLKEYHKILTDAAVPFGLDQTLIQGVKGVLEGQQTGAEIGKQIANDLCNKLGL